MYQHPLAYLLGLQGIALMRAFTGEYDREFTETRLAEIRELLDDPRLWTGAEIDQITTGQGYDAWASTYDRPGNALIDFEQPIVREILDGLPIGVALDAACGTGRHTAYLAGLGHAVIGVDGSPAMLAQARDRVPGAELHQGDLHRLPVSDRSVDVLVCGLALAHVAELGPVLAEFARVLRPGGHLVVSDTRGLPGARRYPLVRTRPDGHAGYVVSWAHPTSAYLAAALPLGFEVLRCEEPRRAEPYVDPDGVPPAYRALTRPDGPTDIWGLHPWSAAATNAAYRGTPAVIVWHLRLKDSRLAGR